MESGRCLAGRGSSSPRDEPDQLVVFINCSGGTWVPAGNVESSKKARSPTVEPLPSDVPSTTAPLPMVTLSPMTTLAVLVLPPRILELLPATKFWPMKSTARQSVDCHPVARMGDRANVDRPAHVARIEFLRPRCLPTTPAD